MNDPGIEQLCAHVPGLGKRVQDFLESFLGADYDGCLLLTYPKLFEMVPREFMRQKIMETFHNEDMDMSMDLVSIDKVGNLVDHEKGEFVKIDYTVLMAIRFKEDMSKPLEEEKAGSKKKFMLDAFEAQYGRENIWFEETTKSYCFHVKNHMVAIQDKHSPQWTFLTLKKGPVMKKFLPDDVRIIFEADMDD